MPSAVMFPRVRGDRRPTRLGDLVQAVVGEGHGGMRRRIAAADPRAPAQVVVLVAGDQAVAVAPHLGQMDTMSPATADAIAIAVAGEVPN